MKNTKKIDKILTVWFIVFTTILFILERVWAQVITSQIALYIYLANAITMIIVRIIYEIIKRIKKK